MGYLTSYPFGVEVAKGNVPGASSVLKFGRNPAVGTTTEDVWDGGGIWVPPTQPRVHNVASSDINDTSAGTGAQTVEVIGLTSDFNEVSETIVMDGTTNVPTAFEYIRIYRMKVLTAGSGGENAGNITATAVTDATVTAQISIGNNQTLMAIYTIPAGKQGLLHSWYANNNLAGLAGAVDFQLRIKEDGSVFQVKNHLGVMSPGDSLFQHFFESPLVIPEKSDIKVNATGSAVGQDASAGFDLYLFNT